jgi:hypothetical protein
MTNNLLRIKIKQRLNKLSSMDYDNIEDWMIAEAVNKVQNEWSRRQRHGSNVFREGDEGSKQRIDDLQVLLKHDIITGVNRPGFFESLDLPDDYIAYKRVSILAERKCCPDAKKMKVYLVEEANIDEILRDSNKKPSFEWAETICTLSDNKVRIYTDEFSVKEAKLVYYRKPRQVAFAGMRDISTGLLIQVDIELEFNDEICDILLDEAAATLAGDIESMVQMARNAQAAERNN